MAPERSGRPSSLRFIRSDPPADEVVSILSCRWACANGLLLSSALPRQQRFFLWCHRCGGGGSEEDEVGQGRLAGHARRIGWGGAAGAFDGSECPTPGHRADATVLRTPGRRGRRGSVEGSHPAPGELLVAALEPSRGATMSQPQKRTAHETSIVELTAGSCEQYADQS